MATMMLVSGGGAGAGGDRPPLRACSLCGERWPGALATCPNDGSELAPLPAHPGTTLTPGAKVGDYVITGVIGEGGMATIYAGAHPLIGKRVAIKVISPELCTKIDAVQRFVQEARTVSQLGHPNIVDVFTFGTLADGRCFFVMEWLLGDTLAACLHGPALTFAAKLSIVAQICDALEAAHVRGIVHRDLKPENVFLVPTEHGQRLVKLLDFGIAKLTSPTDATLHAATRTGLTIGTPQYLSPEQARGRNVDHRTDLYALGVVMFEMFTGRLPFVADNAADLVAMHLHELAPAPSTICPSLPPPLDALIVRMLAKDVDARPRLAEVRAEMQAILKRFAGDADAMTSTTPILEPWVQTSLAATHLSEPPTTRPLPRLASGVAWGLLSLVLATGVALGVMRPGAPCATSRTAAPRGPVEVVAPATAPVPAPIAPAPRPRSPATRAHAADANAARRSTRAVTARTAKADDFRILDPWSDRR